MNEELRQAIIRLRSTLQERNDAPRLADIHAGNAHAECEIESWRKVLVECDGGRFGAIDLWSSEELPSHQSTMLDVENPSDYLVIGQILYEPVVIERSTGTLRWLPLGAPSVALGTPEHFLSHFVFGAGYGEVIPDVEKEHWWQFLSAQTR